MRTDIPRKRRFIDRNAETHERQIHSVEIADDFITLFCKESIAKWWNRGTPHNPKKYHCECEHNWWIDHYFPGKSAEGWSQHIHLLVDNPTWADIAEYTEEMSDDLIDEIRASFDE